LEVITLRNEALAKDKNLLSLVERLKSSEAKMSAQAEAHKAEVEELKRKVAVATENFDVQVVKHEICKIERSRVQKNVDELRAGKEKCYEISMECTKNLKNSFSKVGAFSCEQKFIRGDPMELSSGSVVRPKLLKKFLVIGGFLCLRRCPQGCINSRKGRL
jgi:predicted RNase H-like nuclease (RuvC/YqgF family)